jgi:hypothetical protein
MQRKFWHSNFYLVGAEEN